MNSAYHQITLAPESRNITAFTTHCGTFRYKTLFFGCSSASEDFANELGKKLAGLEGVIAIADSGRPGSKFSPGRDRAGMTFIPAGTGIEMKTRPGPGLASSRPGPGPGFFQYFSISVKMKQCYMLNKIFQNKLRYVKLKLTVSSSQGRIQGGGATGAAATWICSTMKPYTVVSSPHFINLLSGLNRRFNIPSEKVIRTSLIPKLYVKVQYKLKEVLSELFEDKRCYYSVSLDAWSSKALDSYLGLVIHFVTEDFKRKMVLIRCLPYNSSHTGDSIHERFKFILHCWSLPKESLHVIISDTAANMVKAFQSENWGGCFEHVLALSIKHSIFSQAGVHSLLKKTKALVKKLRTPSGKRILELRDSLKLPSETRWNSHYIMLESVNKSRERITAAQSYPELGLTANQQLSPMNWELLTKIFAVLKPAFIATKEAEGDTCSISDVIPLVKKLHHEINAVDRAGIVTFKTSFVNNLERYFDSKYNIESRKEYCIATLLDPRYKSAGFRSKDNAGIAKELLIQEVITDRQSNNSSPQTLNVSDRSIASETPSADPWDAILVATEDSEEDATEDTILPIRKQVSEYLKEKRIPLKSDPLSDYWAMKKDRFDIISPLVRKYLSAPPASTSVERLFSVAGNTVNTKRLSLKPENLESNIFLNYNLRALCVASKEDAKEVAENFVAPNSTCNELPATVSGN